MARLNNVDEHMSMLLSCYLDGELTAEELSVVVAALETDLDAIAEFRRLQAVRRSVRLLPSLHPPLHLLPSSHLSEELSAYLDGELTTAEIPAVTGHLDSCSDCRRELADLDRSRIAVRALPGVEPPAFLDVERHKRAGKRRRWVPAAMVGGAAAVALVVTLGTSGDGTAPAAVDMAEFQARHTAVASVPSAVAVEASNP